MTPHPSLAAVLDGYVPRTEEEARDVDRLREIAAGGAAWARSSPVHATGSGLIVHPPTGRLLLRWHQRMQAWLQVGGHGDPGETSPLAVALREGREETGITDLAPWPNPARPEPVQLVIVPVPAWRGDPEHHHADIRYLLATGRPEDAIAESAVAQLRWLTLQEAFAVVFEPNLKELLTRAGDLLPLPTPAPKGAPTGL